MEKENVSFKMSAAWSKNTEWRSCCLNVFLMKTSCKHSWCQHYLVLFFFFFLNTAIICCPSTEWWESQDIIKSSVHLQCMQVYILIWKWFQTTLVYANEWQLSTRYDNTWAICINFASKCRRQPQIMQQFSSQL